MVGLDTLILVLSMTILLVFLYLDPDPASKVEVLLRFHDFLRILFDIVLTINLGFLLNALVCRRVE